MSWFPVLLAIHVSLAVALLLPSVALPFLLRRAATDGEPTGGDEPAFAVRALMAMQGTGTVLISLGLAATGVAMLWILGPQLLAEPWLLVALLLYALNLATAAFISRPNLRRLIGLRATAGGDATWRRRARQQRLVAYGMAGVIGVIGLLMSTKPQLW